MMCAAVGNARRERQQTRPLQGCRILVSRARSQARELSDRLRSLGAEVLEIPFIEIRPPRSFKPLDQALQDISSYDWLVLTSVNGVQALCERLGKLRIAAEKLDRLKIAAIGPATRKAIASRGLRVNVVPEKYVAESVARSLRSRVRGKRILLVRAKVARDVIPRELRRAGAEVDVVEAYETRVPRSSRQLLRKALADPQPLDIITFTSSSTARNFACLLGGAKVPREVKLASIGPVTSATLRELGLRVQIKAESYTIPGLVEAILRWRE